MTALMVCAVLLAKTSTPLLVIAVLPMPPEICMVGLRYLTHIIPTVPHEPLLVGKVAAVSVVVPVWLKLPVKVILVD